MDIIEKVKRHPQNGRKKFASDIFDEGLISRIYKEHCYGPNDYIPQNPYIEALTPSGMVFTGGSFRR